MLGMIHIGQNCVVYFNMWYPRQVWSEWRKQHSVKNNSPLDFNQSDKDVEDEERKKLFLCKIFDEAENKLTAKNFTSLKNNFLAFIYNTAEAYPGTNFTFIFDAVNQFSSEKDAHDMWWIPQKTMEAPKNVNFVVSTLSTESGTFENAQKVADASIIKIEYMPQWSRMVIFGQNENFKISNFWDHFLVISIFPVCPKWFLVVY